MIFTGRVGKLRVYDGSEIIAGEVEANMSCEVYDASGPTFTDKTSEAYADDADTTGNFFADTNDKIYVGQKTTFARIKFLVGNGTAASGSGALTIKYYNGSSWVEITDKNDGTASGGDTLAASGYIDFNVPGNWAKQGDASLDSDKYYIQLSSESVPGTKPDADILAPVDGQYFEVIFSKMDFNAPIGRGMTEEILKLNRDKMDSNGHYIEGDDSALYEPLDLSFSCALDDISNQDYVFDSIVCGNPGSTYWDAAGVSTKQDTKNDGTNYNPAFDDDTNKKTVDVQVLFENTNGTYDQGFAYYEVYFPDENQPISESTDDVTFSAAGAVYGVIEQIGGFGDRY